MAEARYLVKAGRVEPLDQHLTCLTQNMARLTQNMARNV
jgi:hypothetical protein